MQKAEVVLAVLRNQSTQSKDFVFDRLYRNLFNPDFYMLAYGSLYAKEGGVTPGTDGKTIDGFNIHQVNGIIEKIRNEIYYPQPSRRTRVPQKNGKLRPLGVSSFADKLVQEVLRMMLAAIYEPIFKETSHGFRPEKSCHTALLQVKRDGQGAVWAVEGDIKGFFDNIDHDILLGLLAKKIADGRIIGLVRRFLKAGYFEFHPTRGSLTGIPQGNLISPVLANVYLHELDAFMEGLCRGQNIGKLSETAGPEFTRVRYVRCADDFLILVNGNKELACMLKKKVGGFLKTKLNLDLSEEKTLVTRLSSESVRFLGYEIRKAHENTAAAKGKNGAGKRSVNGTIQLLVPGDVIRAKLKPFMRNNKPVHLSERLNAPVLKTLMAYNAEIRGLYNYYRLAADVSGKLAAFKHYHYSSLLKTIASKEQISVLQVLAKYGISVRRGQGTGTRRVFGVTYETKDGPRTRTYFNDPLRKMDTPYVDQQENFIRSQNAPPKDSPGRKEQKPERSDEK
jgi:group II intron reverse transcriptase/maturase